MQKVSKYNYVYTKIPQSLSKVLRDFQLSLPSNYLLEKEFHITINHSLLEKFEDEILQEINEWSFGKKPLKFQIEKTSCFDSENKKVLKINLLCRELEELNSKLSIYTKSKEQTTFIAHITIATTKNKVKKEFLGVELCLNRKNFYIDNVYLSNTYGNIFTVTLNTEVIV